MRRSKRDMLNAFLNSRLWDSYQSDYSLNLQHWYINDPERAERMDKAFSNGNFGLTHAETMEDWRDCIQSSTLAPGTKSRLHKEVDECWDWHKKNGSLDEET
jgi:hypothetical protein